MKKNILSKRNIIKILLSIMLLANVGCNNNEPNDSTPRTDKQTYITAKPQKVSYANEISATGTLSNKNEYGLSFMVGGIINFLNVNEGDYVKKGATLARINQTSVNVMTKRLSLGYEKAQRDYERVEAMYKDKVITLEDLQNAKTGLDNARLQLESAQFSRQYATIKAPNSGKILSVLAEKNEMTQAGSPIIIMGSIETGKVLKTNLSDIDIVKVALQDPCSIKFDAFPNTVFSGYISEIGAADRYTGTYEIEIFVSDTKNRLKSGLIGEAKINSKTEKEFLQIPIEALVYADKMIGEINVLLDGKKQSKKVEIAKILGKKLLIKDGLSGNEEIIIN